MKAVACPHCNARLQLPDEIPAGRKLRCPKCQERFDPAEVPAAPSAAPSRPAAKQPLPKEDAPEVLPVPAAGKKPVKRVVKRDTDDDDDDEPLERPRRRKKAKPAGSGKSSLLVSVGVGVAIAAVALGVVFYVQTRHNNRSFEQDASKVQAVSLPGVAQLPGGGGEAGSGVVKPIASWQRDLDKARQDAARQGKDLFVLFYADWDADCKALEDEILTKQQFWDYADKSFIPVLLDYPREPPKEPEKSRLERLQSEYSVHDFPTLVLMDSQALPYAVAPGYQAGAGVIGMLQWISMGRGQKDAIKSQIARVDQATDKSKLSAARDAYQLLLQYGCVVPYRALMQRWVQLARQYDAQNVDGQLEFFICWDWMCRSKAHDEDDSQGGTELLAEVQQWPKSFQFKDSNLAAEAYSMAAWLHFQRKEIGQARQMLKLAQTHRATDPQTLGRLRVWQTLMANALSKRTGTGFLVTTDGFVVTNRHVVDGAEKLKVRFPQVSNPMPARIVAIHPAEDIAILQTTMPEEFKTAPLVLDADHAPRRGEVVGIFGYPLGQSVGSGVKFSVGHISALPERETRGMLVLDSRVNPGNSGGPLCSPAGSVVGLVTAKTRSSANVDSYGMALPATKVRDFLLKQLPSFQSAPIPTAAKPWTEIDDKISPAVVMILEED